MKKKTVILIVVLVIVVALLATTFYGNPILNKSAEINFAELERRQIVVGGDDKSVDRVVLGAVAVDVLEEKFKDIKFYKKYIYENNYYEDTVLYCIQFIYTYKGEEIEAFVNFDLKSTTVTVNGEKFCLGRFMSQEKHNEIVNEFLEIAGMN